MQERNVRTRASRTRKCRTRKCGSKVGGVVKRSSLLMSVEQKFPRSPVKNWSKISFWENGVERKNVASGPQKSLRKTTSFDALMVKIDAGSLSLAVEKKQNPKITS